MVRERERSDLTDQLHQRLIFFAFAHNQQGKLTQDHNRWTSATARHTTLLHHGDFISKNGIIGGDARLQVYLLLLTESNAASCQVFEDEGVLPRFFASSFGFHRRRFVVSVMRRRTGGIET